MSETFGRYTLDQTISSDPLTSTVTGVVREGALQSSVRIRRANVSETLDDELLARFDADAKAVASILHENITPVLDYGIEDGTPYLVLPAAETQTLRRILAAAPGNRLSPEIVALIGLDAARGLEHAHASNPPLIHRGISPDVLEIDEQGTVQIADYALNGLLTEASRRVSALLEHTCRYRSPEQTKHAPLTGATDVFSLGATLYEALAGRPAFDAPTPLAIALKVSMAALDELDEVAPGAPAPLRALVMEMLALDESRRPSAEEAAKRLSAIATSPAARDALGRSVLPLGTPSGSMAVAAPSGSLGEGDATVIDTTDRGFDAQPPPRVASPFPSHEADLLTLDADRTDPDRGPKTITQPFVTAPPDEAANDMLARSLPGYRPGRAPVKADPMPMEDAAPVPIRSGGSRTLLLVGYALGAIVIIVLAVVLTVWLVG